MTELNISTIIVFIAVIAVGLATVVAEPPPSNSYLPPPPAARGSNQPQGYSSGRPEVVAARSFGGPGQNGLARNIPASVGSVGGSLEPGYDVNGAAFGRNALQDGSSEPASYNFGYMVNDNFEGTDFGHHEERLDNKAQGQYHVVLPDGRKQTVRYEADERGFKPRISHEDTVDVLNSNGYDSNANGIGGNGGSRYKNGGGGYKNGGSGRGNGYSNGGAGSGGY